MAPIPSSPHDGRPKPQVHAMVIPFPAQGHIGPMMHLSLKLARQEGFSITFVNTQYNHPLLSHLLPTFRDEGLDIRLVEVYDKRDTGHTTGAGSIVELCNTFFSLQPQFEELVQSLITPTISSDTDTDTDTHSHSRPPLSLIIADLYLYFTLDLAAKFSLPHLAFWTASTGTLASVLAINRGHRPNPDDPLELVRWIPGVPPLKPTEINSFLQCYDPAALMYNVFLEPYQRRKETTGIVFNTFEELEHESLEALREENERVFSVGPLLPPAYLSDGGGAQPNGGDDEEPLGSYQTASLWPEDHACLKWLNGRALKSVLYVSFGSIAVLSREQFEELALGLEASGVALLWVIRPDLMYGEKALFPRGYLERMKEERAYFVEWAPQLQVLRHGAVGGFLTHCGWNSTLEGICAGVPMLGWPYFADQMLNNRCCVDAWGVGLTFESDPLLGQLVRRQEVEDKVRELMGPNSKPGAAIRQKALGWREAARKATLLKGGSSERSWTQLVESIRSQVAAPRA